MLCTRKHPSICEICEERMRVSDREEKLWMGEKEMGKTASCNFARTRRNLRRMQHYPAKTISANSIITLGTS